MWRSLSSKHSRIFRTRAARSRSAPPAVTSLILRRIARRRLVTDYVSMMLTRSLKQPSEGTPLVRRSKDGNVTRSAFDTRAISATTSISSSGCWSPRRLEIRCRFRSSPISSIVPAPEVRTENGQLVGFVFVDITSSDINGYVSAASQKIDQEVKFPPGYYIQWAGQFQYLQEAEKRLSILIPFTLLIIFVLIYVNTSSVTRTFIVLLSVPFSLVGAFWLLYLLGYNMSVAVWVGLIALAGVSAETGVVMLLYLDHAWDKYRLAGRMNNIGDLYEAVKEGAVQRIRPKMMTVCAILFGLLPIMWSPALQAGADVMK